MKTDAQPDKNRTEPPSGYLRSFWERVTDAEKPPRLWWSPPVPVHDPDADANIDHQAADDEASKTIRRVMLTIIGYSFFCLLTLSSPDSVLVKDKIKIPFANIEVSFTNFLLVGPVVLIALTTYMHIFVVYRHGIPKEAVPKPLPFIFNMDRRMPRLLSAFLFYWMPPLVLMVFVERANFVLKDVALLQPLSLAAFGTMAVMLWLNIRYWPAARRKWVLYPAVWAVFIICAGVAVVHAGKTLNSAIPPVRAWAASITDTMVASLFLENEVETASAKTTTETKPPTVAKVPPPKPAPVPATAPAPKKPASEAEQPAPKPKPVEPNLEPSAVHLTKNIAEQKAKPEQIVGSGLSLAGVDLRGVDLMKRNLKGADLQRANFSDITISGTKGQLLDFDYANLQGADFSRSQISRTSFYKSDLRHASFRSSSFRSALFSGAKLKGADFSDAKFWVVSFNQADLHGVVGLTCKQLQESYDFEKAYRDESLACGKPIPTPPKS